MSKEIGISLSTYRQLKSNEGYDYFGIGDYGYIDYLPSKRIEIVEEKELKFFTNKYRQETKIGRLLSFDYNDSNLETIVNKYKVSQKIAKEGIDSLFKIVDGDDIKYWYNEKHYVRGGGQLNSSCMRNKPPKRFEIYSSNKNVCKLLILLDESGKKILGRSLLWFTDSGWYVDRPYCRYDSDRQLYKKYAELKGYKFYDNDLGRKMVVKLDKVPPSRVGDNPYMDTFKYYYLFNNTLSNKNVIHCDSVFNST